MVNCTLTGSLYFLEDGQLRAFPDEQTYLEYLAAAQTIPFTPEYYEDLCSVGPDTVAGCPLGDDMPPLPDDWAAQLGALLTGAVAGSGGGGEWRLAGRPAGGRDPPGADWQHGGSAAAGT